ncbi:unnamed protein product [Triticum turgidum subsp. durum]|uniref:Sulfotransferase n=1 Tax=Triticum turgidum subsp. durum TaxID=4567 RepID=A0A9R1Q1M3_TRITD|nr:unnamed protein product [Triticum turgidum subsp. durum]
MAQVGSEIKESSGNDPAEALVATFPTREGWSTPLTLYNNCWLRSHMLREFMLVRDNFKPRRDDIILATHPKSGTTWLKALAFTICSRSRCDFTDSPLLTTNQPTTGRALHRSRGWRPRLPRDAPFAEAARHPPASLAPPARRLRVKVALRQQDGQRGSYHPRRCIQHVLRRVLPIRALLGPLSPVLERKLGEAARGNVSQV